MTSQTEALRELIAANREFLKSVIAENTDPNLPPDTDVDEYINMLASYPRSVRRAMRGANAGIVDVCRALRVAMDVSKKDEAP